MNQYRPMTPRAPINLNPKPNKSFRLNESKIFDSATLSKAS